MIVWKPYYFLTIRMRLITEKDYEKVFSEKKESNEEDEEKIYEVGEDGFDISPWFFALVLDKNDFRFSYLLCHETTQDESSSYSWATCPIEALKFTSVRELTNFWVVALRCSLYRAGAVKSTITNTYSQHQQ